MTREKAVNEYVIPALKNTWNEKVCAEVINALRKELCEDISEDGTLTVNVEDGNKVSRVLVCGDNHFGGLYYPEQEPILDKIRAELVEEKECAYADFERYKVEYLGQDWEDVYDSLPQDDFRYGMERCIEIIDKYKAESEVQE